MSIRAVICDIYHTLLAVSPPPADSETTWSTFWHNMTSAKPPLSQKEFSAATRAIIAQQRTEARAEGVEHPEILWAEIISEALPEIKKMSPAMRDEFMWQQAQALHATHMMPGAADALRKARSKGLALGLASNSQAYTLRELDACLATVNLSRDLFDSAICFFSFEHGFSKPDIEVFHLLSKKLIARGIQPEETLMVGNRIDNDVTPAQAAGWQTWHFTEQPGPTGLREGNWEQFGRLFD